MATRLYPMPTPPYPGVPSTDIAYDATWSDTSLSGGFDRCSILIVDPLNVPGGGQSNASTVAGPTNVFVARFQTPPLDVDQTITGTVTGQHRAHESNANANAMAQMVVYVLAPDLTVRGTLLAPHTNALSSEWNTSTRNVTWPLLANSPAALSSVAALAGDRIVVEMGARRTQTNTTNYTFTMTNTADNASDLPADQTTTSSAFRAWIEFSQDLTFALPPRIQTMCLMGMGA